jgi:C_GCAxxG_C_C family probable redox protein
MGHCAPTIMQTVLDASQVEAHWLVKMTAGLPGGIGNTGHECGAITAPLILLGLRHARDPLDRGVPVVVCKGQNLLRRFAECEGTTLCHAIRGRSRVPLRCVGVVRRGPEQYARTLARDCSDAISGERRDAYGRLHAHFVEKGFHCAQAVIGDVAPLIPVGQALLDGVSGFMGGTAFAGMTCSAFAAGVMAMGVAVGTIENSHLRVLRMIARMAAGGDAFADDVNAFNRIMNLGHRLSERFTAEFGSTQCRAITEADFSTAAGVRHFVDSDGTAKCAVIAQTVARHVREMIDTTRAAPAA